jgi:GNAT superfamily N-acetyltransferase
MGDDIGIRPAAESDVPAMARLHVASWRTTYRGLMDDAVLDDPAATERREAFWTAALTDPAYAANRSAVAEQRGSMVGIAMAGPTREAGLDWAAQLYVLYTSPAVHGLGAGAALLDAVVDEQTTTGLWVAVPNPRAQAFYVAHGFLQDGPVSVRDGVPQVRMVRPAQARS